MCYAAVRRMDGCRVQLPPGFVHRRGFPRSEAARCDHPLRARPGSTRTTAQNSASRDRRRGVPATHNGEEAQQHPLVASVAAIAKRNTALPSVSTADPHGGGRRACEPGQRTPPRSAADAASQPGDTAAQHQGQKPSGAERRETGTHRENSAAVARESRTPTFACRIANRRGGHPRCCAPSA